MSHYPIKEVLEDTLKITAKIQQSKMLLLVAVVSDLGKGHQEGQSDTPIGNHKAPVSLTCRVQIIFRKYIIK